MIHRPTGMSSFEFVVLSGLRAAQLTRGCVPRIDGGIHKIATMAQMEVAGRHIVRAVAPDPIATEST